jgi:methylmalonyl-CoA/ethylmalonyl-CoA epimerase
MKIDHVGIAVTDMKEGISFCENNLGLTLMHSEEVPTQHVRVAFMADDKGDKTQVELLEPLGDEGAVAAFIKKRGPGLHHLAFHTGDIAAEMKMLTSKGVPPLEDKARPGARGHDVCFLHPKKCGGVLIELVSEGKK